jgi:threonine dehydrogenase-like Zn-dependent dehydrogenase
MKAIVAAAPNRLELQELPLPAPGAGQVRIRTAACGICATDLEMIAGWERTPFPAIPGHEWSGRVDAVGPGGDAALVGRLCVGDNVLADGGEVGFEHPGGYAGYFITEAGQLQLLPDDFPPAAATLIEPLAVTVRAWRRLRLEDFSAALILGDGPIGLLMTMVLKRAGVGRLALVGGRDPRLELARQLGAAQVLNYHAFGERGLAEARERLGQSFPNIVEASGSGAAANAAIGLAGKNARIVLVGDYKKARADFTWNRVLLGELEVVGSNTGAQAWGEAVQIALGARAELARLVSREWPAESFAEAFQAVHSRRDLVKAVLRWPSNSYE